MDNKEWKPKFFTDWFMINGKSMTKKDIKKVWKQIKKAKKKNGC